MEIRRMEGGDEAAVLATRHLFDEEARPEATAKSLGESDHHRLVA